MEVVFIPKAANVQHCQAKDYRPISHSTESKYMNAIGKTWRMSPKERNLDKIRSDNHLSSRYLLARLGAYLHISWMVDIPRMYSQL